MITLRGDTVRPERVDLAPSTAGWACCRPNCRDGSRAGLGWRSFHGIHGRAPRATRSAPSSDAAARAGGTCGCGGTIVAGRCGSGFCERDPLKAPRLRCRRESEVPASRFRLSVLSCFDEKTGGFLRALDAPHQNEQLIRQRDDSPQTLGSSDAVAGCGP